MSPSTAEIQRFHRILTNPNSRIMAVCGAGLSASSGLPTFRGAGGLWRNHEATSLATPESFEESPGLVWLFYSWRRHMSLQAKPNMGHFALAELAKKMQGRFLCVSQNVDGKFRQRTAWVCVDIEESNRFAAKGRTSTRESQDHPRPPL